MNRKRKHRGREKGTRSSTGKEFERSQIGGKEELKAISHGKRETSVKLIIRQGARKEGGKKTEKSRLITGNREAKR